MNIPIQIDVIGVSRASNAAHFEYMETVRRRLAEVRITNIIWRQAVDEFNTAFEAEDKAFKQYRDSELTDPIKAADKERDRLYGSLRDSIKAYAKFPIGDMATQAAPLKRVLDNYRITTRENYMRESGLIENMLQDLMAHRSELEALNLLELAEELKHKNNEVRELIAARNEERMEQVLGALKAARQVCDEAYAVVVFYTNALFAMNPMMRDVEPLVLRMKEDLEYFRQHAMAPSHRTSGADPQPDGEATTGQEGTEES
jgi:hypothetical protein